MDNENKELNISTIYEDAKEGDVAIADDVVATIAALAATDVEGVYAMHTNITNEIAGRLGAKNLSKGVKITIEEGEVFVDLSITMKYGYSIPQTAKTVQEKVKAAIENMTGLTVSNVAIRIVGIELSEEEA